MGVISQNMFHSILIPGNHINIPDKLLGCNKGEEHQRGSVLTTSGSNARSNVEPPGTVDLMVVRHFEVSGVRLELCTTQLFVHFSFRLSDRKKGETEVMVIYCHFIQEGNIKTDLRNLIEELYI